MKRPSQRDRVRRHLLEHGTITNVQAVEMKILRLSERIRELQDAGMKIEGDWVRVDGKKTGTYRYTLEGGPRKIPRVVYEVRDGVRYAKLV